MELTDSVKLLFIDTRGRKARAYVAAADHNFQPWVVARCD